MNRPRRLIILTDGHTNPHTAKTAYCIVRYKPEEVVALLDRTLAGRTCQEVIGTGGPIPFVASLSQAPEANTLLIGIAPPGGKIPRAWRPLILEAVSRKMDVVSGLHDFLVDDPEFAAAARQHGVRLVDVRKQGEKERDVSQLTGIREGCLRIHTVGNDCSLGKMVTSVEIARGLQRVGVDAKFVATGQTGILVEGDGCPVDRVICDFLNGAAERLVLANQHHEVIVIEGQGSLFHPRYSCVTLGLLHGSMPDGLVMCYEVGRKTIDDLPRYPLPSLQRMREVYEMAANLMHPCRVIGVGMNSSKVSAAEAASERDRVRRELGLPVCDVIRDGPEELVQAVLDLKRQLRK
jgi:uncharacterized NAD-dependent epimerase/dehydratase family protein